VSCGLKESDDRVCVCVCEGPLGALCGVNRRHNVCCVCVCVCVSCVRVLRCVRECVVLCVYVSVERNDGAATLLLSLYAPPRMYVCVLCERECEAVVRADTAYRVLFRVFLLCCVCVCVCVCGVFCVYDVCGLYRREE